MTLSHTYWSHDSVQVYTGIHGKHLLTFVGVL